MDTNKDTKETHLSDKKPSLESSQDLIGKQIDDYKIIKEIGHGGMAVVYEAYQISLDRNVALKLIPQLLAEEPEYSVRFKREASAAARLNHPNIVSIHGFGQFGNTYYYVMDIAKGKNLDEIIEDKKHELLKSAKHFNADDTLKIIEQAANALSYAHSQGVTHRDIKPGNLIIDEETGRVLITDFGLAKSAKWEKITPRASLFGTPAYMSPEQASGKELDQRTDIYSLGAVLYEMLTGCMPYSGTNALEVIDKVKSQPLTQPRKLNPDIPQGIESIILKAMSKDIWLRYQKMDELLQDIKRFRKGSEIITYVKIAKHKIDRERRIKRSLLVVPVFIILALFIIFVPYAWLNYSKKQKDIKEAYSKFQLAVNYEHLGMLNEAIKTYKEIIDKYPNTEYADLAREKLSLKQ